MKRYQRQKALKSKKSNKKIENIEYIKTCSGRIILKDIISKTQYSVKTTELLRDLNIQNKDGLLDDFWLDTFLENITIKKKYIIDDQKISLFDTEVLLPCIIRKQELKKREELPIEKEELPIDDKEELLIEKEELPIDDKEELPPIDDKEELSIEKEELPIEKKETPILKKYKVCKVNKKTINIMDILLKRDYFESLIAEFANIDAIFIEKKRDEYVICPEQPFPSKKFKDQWIIINRFVAGTNKNKMIMIFLQNIIFQYYSLELKIDDLFDTKEIIIPKLEAIKIIIQTFYKNNFKIDIGINFIYITLNQYNDKLSNQLVFDIKIIPANDGMLFVPFTTSLMNPSINELIDRIKQGNLWLYSDTEKLFKEGSIPECLNKEQTKQTEKIKHPVKFTYISPKLSLEDKFINLFNTKKSKIKVISYYNYPNEYHTYCSIFLLILINDKYFELSIQSRTYYELEKVKNKTFFNKFQERLNDILTKVPKISHLERGLYYYYDYVPSICQLYIKPIPNIGDYLFPITLYYKETKEQYEEVLKKIKNEKINECVVLKLLWYKTLITIYEDLFKSEARIHINEFQECIIINCDILHSKTQEEIENLFNIKIEIQQFTQLINFLKITEIIMKNYSILAYSILGYIGNYTKNFIKSIKMFTNSDNVNVNIGFIIFYIFNVNEKNISEYNILIKEMLENYELPLFSLSSLDIKINLKNFIIFINKITSYNFWYVPAELEITDISLLENYLISRRGIYLNYKTCFQKSFEYNISEFDEFCNFYFFFKTDKFIHNMRHLEEEHKTQLKNLCKIYKISFHNLLAHYPSMYKYQIFHLNTNKKNNITYETSHEVSYNMQNIITSRYITLYELIEQEALMTDIVLNNKLTILMKGSDIFFDISNKNINIQKLKEKITDIIKKYPVIIDIDEVIKMFNI